MRGNIFSKEGLQKVGFLGLVIVGSIFISKAIVDKDIRLLICVSLVFVLGVCCLRVRTGVIAMLIYLPFMAFIRRLIYAFNPYIGLDPILIIVSLLTLFMFSYIFIFHGEDIMKQTGSNKLLRYVTYLIMLFILETVNPLQGGLAVGFAGIMYWVVPALWFYFGFFITKKDMRMIIYGIVAIGIITSVYGLRQIYYGFFPFEEYWIRYGGFTALRIAGAIKVFSTFTSPQEFGQYLLIAGIIVFIELFQRPSLYFIWIIGFITTMWGIGMTSCRSDVFYFLIGVVVFISVKAKNWKKAVIGGLIFLMLAFWGISNVRLPSGEVKSAEAAHLRHLAKGVKDPLSEGSFIARVQMVKLTFLELRGAPFGHGIGAATLGVGKFGGKTIGGGEIFQLSVIGTCGVLGLILYLMIMYWLIKDVIFLIKKDSMTYLIPGVLGIWFGITLDARLYSIGPIFWLVWGWIAKERGRMRDERGEKREDRHGDGGTRRWGDTGTIQLTIIPKYSLILNIKS